METPTPGASMMTETIIKPVTPEGGLAIDLTPATVQNRRLLAVADMVSHNTLWLIESESNNVGSIKDPKDVKNLQSYKASLERTWARTKKYNRGGGDTSYENTHPIAFPSMGVLQSMPNTPLRQLAYLNWNLFRTLLEKQGSKMQVFVDGSAIDDIDTAIAEIVEFIDTELGTGEKDADNPGKYDTGQDWPDLSRVGRIVPTPMGGLVHVGEPSAGTPPTVPTDTADI